MHIHRSLLAATVQVYDHMLEGIEFYTYIHDGVILNLRIEALWQFMFLFRFFLCDGIQNERLTVFNLR